MKSFCLLLVVFLSLNATAQDYRFGKVSKEELKLKKHPYDSTAAASVLYENRNSYILYTQSIGFQLITEVQKRIKIYDESGFQYGTEKVYLYHGDSDKEDFSGLKGYTYNLINGKIEESKLQKDGVFSNEESKYWNSETFTFPNLKEGSVVEFKYKIASPFITNVQETTVQKEIPVDYLEASYKFPEYFYFKPVIKGYYPLDIKNTTKPLSINLTSKSRSGGPWEPVSTTYDNQKIDYIEKNNSITVTNVPALKEEPYVNNIDNYRSSIDFELAYVKMPNSPIEYYSSTWEDVTKKIYDYPEFGGELKKSGYFEDEIDALLSDSTSEEQKIALIFNYLQHKMTWNGMYSYIVDDGVRKAFKNNSGNSAEINLMLTAMMNYAGVETFPVLVSTRSHGIPLFPTREGFNYVIAAASINNQLVLLDATSKYTLPNILPERALNWQGRLIKKDGNSLNINLSPSTLSDTKIMMHINMDKEGGITGKVRNQYLDYSALNYRMSNDQKAHETLMQGLEDKYTGIEIDSYEIENQYEINKPLVEQYQFYMDNAYDKIDDKIYISPMFFHALTENPFKLEKREFPIDFSYPQKDSFLVTINVPEGYQILSMPESTKMLLPEDLGSFSYIIGGTENTIQLNVSLELSSPNVPSLHYESIKQYFSKIIEKETEKIVLSQI
ncbi:DUF3857 domain-containing protein [Galbibacter sp. BG1]|uniref:DUF3857 domain-containing protein n=1 Tax=Galbibacter sp. BG1 TaxID=1170699 RepID=UPI0015B8C77B|nr:DUF3857 domain-containing protein [Galbibacter sp. BG1]QLE01783.1 DUF3857 domain-containing protein [Galbibacter sp. BG1]